MRSLFVTVLALALTASAASAQDQRLAERLDAPAASRVSRVIVGAVDRGAPREPLVQKALEGLTKGATAHQVEQALVAFAERLLLARAQLGLTATDSELTAGASALYVGVAPDALARLRAARATGSLAMPLTALTFFVQRGVERDAAVDWMTSMVTADVQSEELLRLQQLIDADVRSGALPAAATAARIEALLLRYRR